MNMFSLFLLNLFRTLHILYFWLHSISFSVSAIQYYWSAQEAVYDKYLVSEKVLWYLQSQL